MVPLFVAVDQLFGGFTLGVTAWHFFFQAPLMFRLMGKEKFVPIMMQLTRLWVQTTFISSSALLLVSLILVFGQEEQRIPLNIYIVGVGWLAMTINRFIVVPKALKAGARSRSERQGDNTKEVSEFVISGGGKTETKALHQTVVVFVLINVVAFVAHAFDLASATVSSTIVGSP